MKYISASIRLCGLLLAAALVTFAQVPTPKDVLGFTPGDDRKLASWAQVVDYFQKLGAASDRVMFEEIGKSTMGAPFVYVAISSPGNLKNLEQFKQINKKLADPRLIKSNDAEAKKLIAQGKTIVLNTYGIHSTEVGSYLSSMLVAHELASSNEPRIRKILDNTIILLVPSLNPDGVDIVKNWYDKTLGTPYEGTNPPELYHKYVGHDNNRDWYAFTQVETQLTVDKIHNVWHPQIVLDVHQQGIYGARQFLPPYMPPVEPNVPKQIVEGFTELGTYIANDLRKKGFQGITTGTTYDAWTPARAYSHYHGGVRILSETASARLATPVTVKAEELRGGRGVNPHKDDANNGPAWKGGEWKLRNITDYMTATAFSLLDHAADNREKWLSRFYEIGKEAVRPRKDGELRAFVLPPLPTKEGELRRMNFIGLLSRAGVIGGFVDPSNIKSPEFVEFMRLAIPILQNKKDISELAFVVPIDQPYGGFAKALLERQTYPDLNDAQGNPIPPYDVTAHTLPLLMEVRSIPLYEPFTYRTPATPKSLQRPDGCSHPPKHGLYRSHIPSMDEGWTRWLFEEASQAALICADFVSIIGQIPAVELLRQEHRLNRLNTIVFPDQSASQILNGYTKGTMPDEYVGGVGKEGVENLKKFVEAGGTLVFLNRSSLFAIEQFKLPIVNVTEGLDRKDFFIPGSILRTELDTSHPIAKGMPEQSIAWFEQSPVFEILSTTPSAEAAATPPIQEGSFGNVRIIARYPSDPKQILLSGWALGAEKIAGKAALVEVTVGKGKIILFGFRPQYRGQSLATFPLLFNAIAQ
ncbi:MAG TPA: M14 family zinc carboxypeptidase [Pyrinomonadaceae bacterium]|nr:M14 family zinc carboxypeptidase [Pyrinomonadaceae bacterium]HMP64317.1 M14 family zinc carboxypeptidase [Pyrinomonadaceae bacterium]